jgi:hypothetical protein
MPGYGTLRGIGRDAGQVTQSPPTCANPGPRDEPAAGSLPPGLLALVNQGLNAVEDCVYAEQELFPFFET